MQGRIDELADRLALPSNQFAANLDSEFAVHEVQNIATRPLEQAEEFVSQVCAPSQTMSSRDPCCKAPSIIQAESDATILLTGCAVEAIQPNLSPVTHLQAPSYCQKCPPSDAATCGSILTCRGMCAYLSILNKHILLINLQGRQVAHCSVSQVCRKILIPQTRARGVNPLLCLQMYWLTA